MTTSSTSSSASGETSGETAPPRDAGSPARPSDLVGREAAGLVRVVLVLAAGASGFIGLVIAATSGSTGAHFAWSMASPVTAVLLAAGFLGAVPMLLYAATRLLWEEVRISFAAVGVVLVGLAAVTLTGLGHTRVSGGHVLPVLLSLAWVAGVTLLAIGCLVALVAQAREPALPLARTAPLPRWALPPVAVEGTALAGLGAGLLLEPAYWGPLLPWAVDAFDGRILGCWCLGLGLALLLALAEDDLTRLRPALLGASAIGVLGLLGIAWRHAAVAWHGAAAILLVALLVGLVATGAIGWRLQATRPTAATRGAV